MKNLQLSFKYFLPLLSRGLCIIFIFSRWSNFFCMIFVIVELYEYCLKEGYADKNLIAKWKKQGYENLCCLRCIQCRDTNFGTNCICRVPKAKLEEVSSCFCYLLWKVILPNVRAIFAVIYTTVLLRYMLTAKLT